jgi:hypothetical protein
MSEPKTKATLAITKKILTDAYARAGLQPPGSSSAKSKLDQLRGGG